MLLFQLAMVNFKTLHVDYILVVYLIEFKFTYQSSLPTLYAANQSINGCMIQREIYFAIIRQSADSCRLLIMPVLIFPYYVVYIYLNFFFSSFISKGIFPKIWGHPTHSIGSTHTTVFPFR